MNLFVHSLNVFTNGLHGDDAVAPCLKYYKKWFVCVCLYTLSTGDLPRCVLILKRGIQVRGNSVDGESEGAEEDLHSPVIQDITIAWNSVEKRERKVCV